MSSENRLFAVLIHTIVCLAAAAGWAPEVSTLVIESGAHVRVTAGGELIIGGPPTSAPPSPDTSGASSSASSGSSSGTSSTSTIVCPELTPCLWQHLGDTRIQSTSPYWSQLKDASYISAVYEGVLRSSSDTSAEADECFYTDRTGNPPTLDTSPNFYPHVPRNRLHNWYSDVGNVSSGDPSCGVVPSNLKCCLNPKSTTMMGTPPLNWAYPFNVRMPSPWVMINVWTSTRAGLTLDLLPREPHRTSRS